MDKNEYLAAFKGLAKPITKMISVPALGVQICVRKWSLGQLVKYREWLESNKAGSNIERQCFIAAFSCVYPGTAEPLFSLFDSSGKFSAEEWAQIYPVFESLGHTTDEIVYESMLLNGLINSMEKQVDEAKKN